MIEPYKIDVQQDVLDDLARRLALFRSPPSAEQHGWEDGTDLHYLRELVRYWRERFDWRAQETILNRFNHQFAEVNGTRLHFLHERGRGPAPIPLVLAHGWPDGFQRFIKIIPLLTDPAAHGGDAADAFDVVVPSLPGFGFSPRGENGPTRAQFGDVFHHLMTGVLGYARYGAHGGDVGAVVCDQLCRHHADAVVGAHFTNVPMQMAAGKVNDLTAAEREFFSRMEHFQRFGAGYMHIQGTKPWTPAAALNDSPAGLAAWIVEKMYAWGDCQGDIEQRFSKDEILTNVMLYWITQSIGTSFLCYRDFMKPSQAAAPTTAATGVDRPRSAPAGFALFPKEIANAPREWADRFYDVRHWTEMPAGGHFGAWEEPTRLAEDLRAFFRPLR